MEGSAAKGSVTARTADIACSRCIMVSVTYQARIMEHMPKGCSEV